MARPDSVGPAWGWGPDSVWVGPWQGLIAWGWVPDSVWVGPWQGWWGPDNVSGAMARPECGGGALIVWGWGPDSVGVGA